MASASQGAGGVRSSSAASASRSASGTRPAPASASASATGAPEGRSIGSWRPMSISAATALRSSASTGRRAVTVSRIADRTRASVSSWIAFCSSAGLAKCR